MTQDPQAAPPPCRATIAICTYNRLHTLPRTLDALSRLRGPHSFEVIVVNGPSDDGTGAYLAARSDVRVLDNPEINLAVSRNIAIANAAGDYIAFIDDDAVPEADWLTLLIDHLDGAPEIAAAGGFIRDANGISFQAKYVYCDVFGNNYPCDNPDYVTFLSQSERLYPSLTGTNIIFRRDAILAVHGFDEVFAYFLDETDVNKRMDDAGMQASVLPEAEIHHKYAASHLRTTGNVARNMYPISRSIAYFAMRHGLAAKGWQAVTQRLQDFYRSEFSWKSEITSYGQIDNATFETLMLQTRKGIFDGIDRHFDTPDAARGPERITRHARPAPPVLRRMRAPDAGLRLCMFSQDHGRDQLGGIGRWSNLVARGLAERGHEVTLIGELTDHQHFEFCDFTADGVWSHNLRAAPNDGHSETDCLGLPPGMAATSRRKLAEVRRIQPRRRFQVASSPIWDVEGAALIGAGDIPTVLSLHTCAGLMLESKPEWKADEHYYRNHVLRVINAEIQALRRAPLILANSRAIMTDIGALYGLDLFERPHVVVPHGIEDIEAPENLAQMRRDAPAGTPLRILFLGRLEARKGVQYVAEVAEALLATGRDIRFDIVGDKVDEALFDRLTALAAQHPDRIRMHGFLDGPALDALMRKCDLFFAPSTYESFGLIFIEAMRYCMPCVAFDTGGVGEVIDHGSDGFLAPLGDSRALRAALERLIDDPDLRARMSAAARARFERDFGYGIMADRLVEVYREAAQMGAQAGE